MPMIIGYRVTANGLHFVVFFGGGGLSLQSASCLRLAAFLSIFAMALSTMFLNLLTYLLAYLRVCLLNVLAWLL